MHKSHSQGNKVNTDWNIGQEQEGKVTNQKRPCHNTSVKKLPIFVKIQGVMCSNSSMEGCRSILPINPAFLSLSAEYQNINIEKLTPDEKEAVLSKYNPNDHGLFDTTTIREFLAVMSSDLNVHSKLPLFQLLPSEYNCGDEDKKWITEITDIPEKYQTVIKGKKLCRIDAGNFFDGNPYCAAFKKNHPSECAQQDTNILLLFHPDLKDCDKEKYSEKLEKICERDFEGTISAEKYSGGVYLTYICECSGFREYAFPIFHNGHIIAAIMIGQKIPLPESFDINGYFTKKTKEERNSLFSEIRNFQPADFAELSTETLNSIAKRISELEKRIDDKVHQAAWKSISKKFDKLEDSFRKSIQPDSSQAVFYGINSIEAVTADIQLIDERLVLYKNALNKTLSGICNSFDPNGLICIYAKSHKMGMSYRNYQLFNLIGTSNNHKDIPESLSFGTDVNLANIDSPAIASMSYPQVTLIDATNDKFHLENNYLDDFSILFREYFSPHLRQYSYQYEIFHSYLTSLFHSLIEPYNVLQAARLSKNLEISMRITTHEAGNVLPTIRQPLSNLLDLDNNEEKYQTTPKDLPDTQTRSLWDVYQRTLMLEGIYKRSTIAFKDIDSFPAYHDLHRLVYSIKTLFDEKAREERKQNIIIQMASIYNNVDLFTDSNLFHQILFNLVDNAVKYGYLGSNIYISIKSDYDPYPERIADNQSFTISITSFGRGISKTEQNHIFDLFYRTSHSKDDGSVEGMGIGLFMARKMCIAMDYLINVSSEKIADLHLPADYFYNHKNYSTESDTNEETLNKTTSNPTTLEIINKSARWHIGNREKNSIIHNPTFNNTFTITLQNKTNSILKFKKR